jgi:type II secretory pathway component PulL
MITFSIVLSLISLVLTGALLVNVYRLKKEFDATDRQTQDFFRQKEDRS